MGRVTGGEGYFGGSVIRGFTVYWWGVMVGRVTGGRDGAYFLSYPSPGVLCSWGDSPPWVGGWGQSHFYHQ